MDKIHQNLEFIKPGLNPFFTALASSQSQPKTITPVQALREGMRRLEKLAEAGDVRAFQLARPEVLKLSEAVHSDGMKRLEIQVQTKTYECTLLLNASKGLLQKAKIAERQAKEAELINQANCRELWANAQKFQKLGEHFQQKLRSFLG